MSYEFIENDLERCIHPEYAQLVTVAPLWQEKLLLILRQSEPFINMYSIPGGHKENETYEEAAKRELNEEVGIENAKLAPFVIFIDHEHKLECHGFKYLSEDGLFVEPVNEEQQIVGWKTIDEALALPLTPGLHESLQRL
ncbi:MAG TPA: NUDIX domain-containing protein [Candidatus Saccharimonadales bacterium]|nr:NUDIX domain-containing protein [Candidatus Saccharimonadales bacterium]